MNCSKCGSPLVIRKGKYGEFYACPQSNPTDNHGTVSPGQQAYNYQYHFVPPVLDLDMEIQKFVLIERII